MAAENNLPIAAPKAHPSPRFEGFVPFVPHTVGQSNMIISDEDREDEAAAIKASIHSPKVVQCRRRRRSAAHNGEKGKRPQNMEHIKHIKCVMKDTTYKGKSKKANSSRDDGGFTSAFKGVTKHKATGKFEAHFWDKTFERPQAKIIEGQKKPRKKGKQIYLGGFASEELAARAYDKAAITFLGDLAELNFPSCEYVGFLEQTKDWSREDILKDIKSSSIAAKAAKRRADLAIKGSGNKGQRNVATKVNFAPSHAAGQPAQESPQFLPYSERRMRRRSGNMVNELLVNNTAKTLDAYNATHQSIQQLTAHISAQQTGILNGLNGFNVGGASPLSAKMDKRMERVSSIINGSDGPTNSSPQNDGQFRSPNEQFSFKALNRPVESISPVPIPTVLKQQYNAVPTTTLHSIYSETPGGINGSSGNGISGIAVGWEKAPGHSTVTFEASGHVSEPNTCNAMKGWMDRTSDQNFDVMQLSPMAKGMQLSPEFNHKGISMSPAKSGFNVPLLDLDDTEMGIAAFLGMEQLVIPKPLNSPGRPHVLPMPSPRG